MAARKHAGPPAATGCHLAEVGRRLAAAYARDDHKTDSVRREILQASGLDLGKLRQRIEMQAEFISRRSDYARVLLSNEHLHSRISNPGGLIRLRNMLERIGKRFRVSVVLRHQDRLATSALSTMVKGGHKNIHPVLPVPGKLPLYYRYHNLLDMYEAVFGPGSVHVAVYEDQNDKGPSLFELFEDVTALGVKLPRPEKGAPTNPALSREGLMLLGKINELAADHQPLSQRERSALIATIEVRYNGRPALISRGEAERFLAACAQQRWLPERAQLFDTDTSSIPAEVPPLSLHDSDLDQTARKLLAAVRENVAAS